MTAGGAGEDVAGSGSLPGPVLSSTIIQLHYKKFNYFAKRYKTTQTQK